jgi:hypothetical protein
MAGSLSRRFAAENSGSKNGFDFDLAGTVADKTRPLMSSPSHNFPGQYFLASPATWGVASINPGMRHVEESRQERT